MSAPVAVRGEVIVVGTDALGDLAASWDALVAASPLPSPFLRSWWLTGLGSSRASHFVLVLEGERLLGGLALQRRRVLGVEVFSVLGGGKLCPDHVDLVADPERRDDVVTALRGWLQRPGARVIDLDGLREDADVLDVLAPARAEECSVAYCETLPDTLEAYLADRSRNFSKKARKARRRLEAAGVTWGRVAPGDVPAALDDFVALHAVRADRQELLRHREEIRSVVLAGTTAGEVVLHEGVRDGERVAVLISFITGGRWSTYQLARSLDHEMSDLGTVLRLVAIEDACEAGFVEWDCLRGDQSFKRSFTSRSRSLLRARAAHGAAGRLYLAMARGREWARRRSGGVVRRIRSVRTESA